MKFELVLAMKGQVYHRR